jgi:hypothetical protein
MTLGHPGEGSNAERGTARSHDDFGGSGVTTLRDDEMLTTPLGATASTGGDADQADPSQAPSDADGSDSVGTDADQSDSSGADADQSDSTGSDADSGDSGDDADQGDS